MGIEGAHRVLIVRSDENDRGRALRIDEFQHFETVQFRHLYVQEHQVGSRRLRQRLHRLKAVGAFAYHANPGMRLE